MGVSDLVFGVAGLTIFSFFVGVVNLGTCGLAGKGLGKAGLLGVSFDESRMRIVFDENGFHWSYLLLNPL